VDVEARIVNLQEDLRKNPREMSDPSACRDVYDWAQIEQERAKRTKDAVRRQQMLGILIAAQKGNCEKAKADAAVYRQRYPGQ
jgi:hypothetical protein